LPGWDGNARAVGQRAAGLWHPGHSSADRRGPEELRGGPLVVRVSHRSRRKIARDDAVRTQRRGFRARRGHAPEEMKLAASLTAGILIASAASWAAFGPVGADDREEAFEIPKGTWARRMAGDKVEILPGEVRLMLGVKDVLVLRNRDDVPQVFGPVLMMPGQSFKLPFEMAS